MTRPVSLSVDFDAAILIAQQQTERLRVELKMQENLIILLEHLKSCHELFFRPIGAPGNLRLVPRALHEIAEGKPD
jgi:hypothetical protein